MTTGYLTDCNGKPSSTRLLAVLCVPALVLGPLAVWAYLSITKGVLLPVEPTIPLYIGSCNAVLLSYCGFKAYQEPVAPPPVQKTVTSP